MNGNCTAPKKARQHLPSLFRFSNVVKKLLGPNPAREDQKGPLELLPQALPVTGNLSSREW